MPIIAGQRAVGVISVQSTTQEGRFNEADLNLLNTIAANVGTALQNAQLHRETERRAEEMAALAEVGREISATLDLPTVLSRIVTHARDLLNADDSAIYLPEPDGQTFKAIAALGEYSDEITKDLIHIGEGIIGDVAQRGAAEVVNYAMKDPRAIRWKPGDRVDGGLASRPGATSFQPGRSRLFDRLSPADVHRRAKCPVV